MATVQGCGFQQVIVVGKVDRPIDSNRYDSVDFPRPGFGGISGESGGSGGSGAPATQTGKAAATSVSNSSKNCEDASNPTTSNPVVIATGEKFKAEIDFVAKGAYGISLTRTYRSTSTTGKIFGVNWPSTLDGLSISYTLAGCRYFDVLCYPRNATLRDPDGAQYAYRQIGSTEDYKVYGSAAAGTLSYIGYQQWQLLRNDKIYTFDASGKLTTVATAFTGAVSESRTYTAGKLTGITNLVGQSVSLAWTGNNVTSITDTGGNVWTYAYNAGMLAMATSPGPAPNIRKYHYEAVGDNTLLTGISINGVRYSTYAYSADKRVLTSGLTGDEERDSFVYGTNQTTVTNAAGQATTYNFTSINGSLKHTSISRASTDSCPNSSSAQTFYDSNGYIQYTYDWNGNRTNYVFDGAGKLQQTTTGANTTAALTAVYTWAGDDLTAIDYKGTNNATYSRVQYSYTILPGLIGHTLSGTKIFDSANSQQRQFTYVYAVHSNGAVATKTVTQSLPNSDTAVTTYTYDTLGNLTAVTNALGQQVLWSSYNGLGLPGRMVDINGVITDFNYDGKGNQTSAVQYLSSGNRISTLSYNGSNQVTDISYPDGRVARFRYSASERLNLMGNAQNKFVQLNIDVPTRTATSRSSRNMPSLSGTTPAATAGGEFISTTQRDSLGRPWKDKGNNGQQVTYEYDGNGVRSKSKPMRSGAPQPLSMTSKTGSKKLSHLILVKSTIYMTTEAGSPPSSILEISVPSTATMILTIC